MNLVSEKVLALLVFVLSFSVVCMSQKIDSSINTNFNEDTNKTTVLLKSIKLPKNKDNFAIGAFFEFPGEKLEKTPCCAGIFFTSISKKKFKFKENHNLTIWADKEKFSFDDVNWQESAGGMAFIIAFPEEIVVGMKSEIFQKIANAKSVKMQLGDFKFALTPEHLVGLKNLVEKMKS
jgi:hypothetical protein